MLPDVRALQVKVGYIFVWLRIGAKVTRFRLVVCCSGRETNATLT